MLVSACPSSATGEGAEIPHLQNQILLSGSTNPYTLYNWGYEHGLWLMPSGLKSQLHHVLP